jgi:hypothetical protein
MRVLGRRILGWVAIYAVAMHTLLAGVAPVFAATQDSFDPSTFICLHDAGGGDPANTQPSGLVPGHACEHCNLCSAVAPPPAPDVAFMINLAPARVLHVLRPVSGPPHCGVSSDPKLARGPPQSM